MKIMLVDDDRTMRTILKTLLEMEHHVVSVWQGDTTEGIFEKAYTEHPDLILLDVHLKEIDGLDIVRQVRKDPELMGVQVLMTSGMDLRDECLLAGANGFILKPYMPDELIEKLHQLNPE